MISRRPFLQVTALAALGGIGNSFAQQYPARPIRLIIPASPGAQIDVTGRFVAEVLSKRLNRPIVVDNRAGAGGILGNDAVARSAPDGYTLLLSGIPLFLTRYLSEAPVSYEPVRDFAPIAMLCSSPLGIAVGVDSPYKTLADLLRAMKTKPDQVTYSSGGAGSAAHICSVMLNDMTQTTARHVPYKGNSPAVTDVAGGQVDFTCQGAGGILPMINGGKLRALAVTSNKRWDALPDTPTVVEAGVPGFELTGWIGVLARSGTPAPIVQLLSDELVRIASSPEFKEFCDKQQMLVYLQDHKQFAANMPRFDAQLKRLALLAKKG